MIIECVIVFDDFENVVAYDAIIDTGAHHCVMPRELLEFVNPALVGKIEVIDARGVTTEEDLFQLSILLPGDLEPRKVCTILTAARVFLIGRSALRERILTVDFGAGVGEVRP